MPSYWRLVLRLISRLTHYQGGNYRRARVLQEWSALQKLVTPRTGNTGPICEIFLTDLELVTSLAIVTAHAAVIPPSAVSPLPGALATPIAAVVVGIGTVIGIPPGIGIPPPAIIVDKPAPTVAVTRVVNACMKAWHAWSRVNGRMARYGQAAAAINSAAMSHEPTAPVISPAANERRMTSRTDGARSDRDGSAVSNRSTAAHESTSPHSGAVPHSATKVAGPDVAHPGSASHSVPPLGDGSIRGEGHYHQHRATCAQQLLHDRLRDTEMRKHAEADYRKAQTVQYDLDQKSAWVGLRWALAIVQSVLEA